MGSYTDMRDVDRFMRSPEGKAHMDGIRQKLKGRKIAEVEFDNQSCWMSTILILDDGEEFTAYQTCHEIDALREDYEAVLDREYYVDYPERKPKQEQEK